MGMKITGIDRLTASINKAIQDTSNNIAKLRRDVAEALLQELFKNIPVWSGRTIASLAVSNTGSAPSMASHPDRRNTSSDGPYRFHPEYGLTNTMALGAEPQRATAEGIALATLSAVTYDVSADVYIVGNSTAWSLVEQGAAPDFEPHRPRNKGIVSTIAVGNVRSKFNGKGVK